MKAKYENGVLRPLDPLDLEEGEEVTVSVERPSRAIDEQRDGPLTRIVRKVQERQARLPPDTWDRLPVDLAENKEHYLYGHPAKEE